MTRTEQISLIRQKCIEANERDPDNYNICVCGHDYFDHKTASFGGFRVECENCKNCEEFNQAKEVYTIRLSDVLLAIPEDRFVSLELWPAEVLIKNAGSKAFWKLTTDDLTEQSDECIEFISSLLKEV